MTLDMIANHLWQSTLCVPVAWLLAFALRKNHAGVRFWVWFAAAVKFVVPFAALVSLGSLVPWKPAPLPTTTTIEIFETVSQLFSLADLPAPAPAAPRFDLRTALIDALPAVWLVGTLVVALRWAFRWRRVSALTRSSTPLTAGREHDILRRLETRLGAASPLAMRAAESELEPGIVGIFRPILLWPAGISARLTDAQIESILAHELAHVRRRDNLTAAIHMAVEAAFWFHPLVWWIGARLVDERERACDEQVVRVCEAPETYAESILRTCEYHTESPLACVSGVTGSDLKKRIAAIMTNRPRHPLNMSRKALLAVAAVLALATPIAIGLVSATHLFAQVPVPTAAGSTPAFEVASIKKVERLATGGGLTGCGQNARVIAENYTVEDLILVSYGLQKYQLVGAQGWALSDAYAIEGKAAAPCKPGEGLLMLRALLADRFKLRMHAETRQMPIYALVRAKKDGTLGPGLRPSSAECADWWRGAVRGENNPRPAACPGERKIGNGNITLRLHAISYLTRNILPSRVGRTVINDTDFGDSDFFDLELNFAPDVPNSSLSSGAVVALDDRPSLFTALQEQLGLKLEARTGPVEVLVIDSVERPSDNDAPALPKAGVAPTPPPPTTQAAATRLPKLNETAEQFVPVTSPDRFDAVSIKENKNPAQTRRAGFLPGSGRFIADSATLGMVISAAYADVTVGPTAGEGMFGGTAGGLPTFQLSDVPDWVRTVAFDIQATTSDTDIAPRRMRAMLRAMLADRFRMTTRVEKREVPAYELRLARSDRRLGAQLTETRAANCVPPPSKPEPGQLQCGIRQSFDGTMYRLNGLNVSMAQLSARLQPLVSRPVIEQTGLGGGYDFTDLLFTPPTISPDAAGPNEVSLLTALREQLGLTLEPRREVIDVLVIDHIERPTEN